MFPEKAAPSEFGFASVFVEVSGDPLNCEGKEKENWANTLTKNRDLRAVKENLQRQVPATKLVEN